MGEATLHYRYFLLNPIRLNTCGYFQYGVGWVNLGLKGLFFKNRQTHESTRYHLNQHGFVTIARFFLGSKLWNQLDYSIKQAPSFAKFKQRLKANLWAMMVMHCCYYCPQIITTNEFSIFCSNCLLRPPEKVKMNEWMNEWIQVTITKALAFDSKVMGIGDICPTQFNMVEISTYSSAYHGMKLGIGKWSYKL